MKHKYDDRVRWTGQRDITDPPGDILGTVKYADEQFIQVLWDGDDVQTGLLPQGHTEIESMTGREELESFKRILKDFKNTAYELLRAWEELDRSTGNVLVDEVAKEYPFGESFDETLLKIMDWDADVRKIKFPKKGVFEWDPEEPENPEK